MDHGDDSRCPAQPYPRESGVLVIAYNDGEELRLHEDQGRWHARRWRVNPIHGQWIGAQVGLGALDLTVDEWRACAVVIGQLAPVVSKEQEER